jgi:hypothetical protein
MNKIGLGKKSESYLSAGILGWGYDMMMMTDNTIEKNDKEWGTWELSTLQTVVKLRNWCTNGWPDKNWHFIMTIFTAAYVSYSL